MEAHELQEMIDTTGGRYALTALLQRRLVSLARGAPPLVETDGPGLRTIAFRELKRQKIALDLPDKPAPRPKAALA